MADNVDPDLIPRSRCCQRVYTLMNQICVFTGSSSQSISIFRTKTMCFKPLFCWRFCHNINCNLLAATCRIAYIRCLQILYKLFKGTISRRDTKNPDLASIIAIRNALPVQLTELQH